MALYKFYHLRTYLLKAYMQLVPKFFVSQQSKRETASATKYEYKLFTLMSYGYNYISQNTCMDRAKYTASHIHPQLSHVNFHNFGRYTLSKILQYC